jgi:hypothetical protein
MKNITFWNSPLINIHIKTAQYNSENPSGSPFGLIPALRRRKTGNFGCSSKYFS